MSDLISFAFYLPILNMFPFAHWFQFYTYISKPMVNILMLFMVIFFCTFPKVELPNYHFLHLTSISCLSPIRWEHWEDRRNDRGLSGAFFNASHPAVVCLPWGPKYYSHSRLGSVLVLRNICETKTGPRNYMRFVKNSQQLTWLLLLGSAWPFTS